MPPIESFTVRACTVHNRVFVPSLNAWLSLSAPPGSAAFADAIVREAACDYCMLTVQCLFQAQFPGLYSSVYPSEY
jgi:hypothetical protein